MAKKRENLQHVDCVNLLNLPNFLFLATVCAVWVSKEAVAEVRRDWKQCVKYGIR